MVSVPGCNLLDLFFITLQFTVCVWSKGTKKWLQHRIDPKQQHTIACERQTFLLAHRRWGTFREKELNLQNVPQWRWARRRWARRNSTRKTSLNGDERGGDEAMSEEELNSQNVPQWRWASRNVCRSQATTHSWHSSFKIESLQFTSKISSIFKQFKITLQIYYSF